MVLGQGRGNFIHRTKKASRLYVHKCSDGDGIITVIFGVPAGDGGGEKRKRGRDDVGGSFFLMGPDRCLPLPSLSPPFLIPTTFLYLLGGGGGGEG